MSNSNIHPSFDQDEQAILSNLVPQGADVTEVITDLPTAAEPAPATQADPSGTAVPPVQAETPAPATAATPEAAPEATPAPQGDTRAALRAARHAEKRLRDENQKLREEVEAIRQGKAPVDTQVTDAELAQLEEDFPLQAKIVRRQREIEQQLQQQHAAAQPAPGFEALSYDPAVQEVIDSVPQLVNWQYDPAGQDKFARAIEYDKSLVIDPDWANKPIAERFAEAVRRTQAALAPATPAPTPSAAPAAARLDPATVIANAPAAGPKGISDFRGGAPASFSSVNYAGMSDEDIMASLPAG